MCHVSCLLVHCCLYVIIVKGSWKDRLPKVTTKNIFSVVDLNDRPNLIARLERCDETLYVVASSPFVSIRQHSSTFVSIRQHTSSYVSIRPEETHQVTRDSQKICKTQTKLEEEDNTLYTPKKIIHTKNPRHRVPRCPLRSPKEFMDHVTNTLVEVVVRDSWRERSVYCCTGNHRMWRSCPE
jgi:hypothetical protein